MVFDLNAVMNTILDALRYVIGLMQSTYLVFGSQEISVYDFLLGAFIVDAAIIALIPWGGDDDDYYDY